MLIFFFYYDIILIGGNMFYLIYGTEDFLINQMDLLNVIDKYEKMGAKCYVIVSIGFQRFYRVPWSVWKTMKERYGHKYMSADNELEPFRVPYTGFIVRFLEGVELK